MIIYHALIYAPSTYRKHSNGKAVFCQYMYNIDSPADAIYKILPWWLKQENQKTVQVSAMCANQLHTYIHTFPMEP